MANHLVFTKEDLERVKMPKSAVDFLSSNPDALKEIILERDYYKAISELQEKQINKFIQKLESQYTYVKYTYAYVNLYKNIYAKKYY
jgi:hypothetical protein